jgi:hypothetical protein
VPPITATGEATDQPGLAVRPGTAQITTIDSVVLFLFCYRMTNRRQRIFSDSDADDLLRAVGECRRAAVLALSRAPIHAEGTKAVMELLAVLDSIAEALTGDRERFWAKPHSTPKRLDRGA